MSQQTKTNPTAAQVASIKFRGKDLLVSAGAGAGKTYALTERVLSRLLDDKEPISLSDMLIVTFTRNATAELKKRVADVLNKAMEKATDEKRQQALSDQLMALGSAEISTIDAFMQKLVRENYDALNIPRNFRIIYDEEEFPIADRVMQEVLKDFYRKGASSSEQEGLFSSLQGNEFAEAMENLVNQKDESALRKQLMDFHEKFANYPQGVELLKQSAKQLEEEISLPYFETRAGKALRAYSEAWVQAIRDATQKKKVNTYTPNVLDFCDNFENHLNRGYLSLQGYLMNGVFPKGAQGYAKEIRTLYSSSKDHLKEEKERSAKFARQLYAFYKAYETRLLEEKKERGVLTFGDITSLAYKLLASDNGEPSAAARELSERYKEIYIDEYQDVNQVQDAIFRILGAGKRFMVGDIKQSIYRFRGGDPQVFAQYRKDMPEYGTPKAETATGNCIFMRENFRCNEPIIETTNLICGNLFQKAGVEWYASASDDLVFNKQKKYPLSKRPVKICLFEKAKDAEEGQITEVQFVANEIHRLLHDENEKKDDGTRISEKDIVILTPKNEQAKPFANALKALGIKVDLQGGKGEIDPELVDLLNLLSVIDNPYRDLPLLEALQTPYFGFTLTEVSQIRSADSKDENSKSHSLFDALECYEGDDALGAKIKKALDFLAEQRKNATTLSVDRFLRRLYETPNFDWVSGSDIPIYLYDLARQYASNAYVGLFEFLRYLEKLVASGNLPANGFRKEENAVRITTIHKSKGEEYPVLFVASLGDGFSDKDMKDPMFFSEALGFSAKLYDKDTLRTRSTVDCEVEKAILKQTSREESLRLLYVALTRAEERLYLCGTPTKSAYEQAESIKNGGRYQVMSVSNLLSWVLASTEEGSTNPYDRKSKEDMAIEANAYTPKIDDLSDNNSENEAKKGADDKPTVEPVAVSPLSIEPSILHRLPSKVAASKISTDLFDRLLDENQNEAIENRLELLVSAKSFRDYLDKEREPNAADRGTATHAFLEFCDFAALKTRSVKEEAARLVEMGFLRKEDLPLIRFEQLESFVNSPLYDMIRAAKEVKREQRFARLVPMRNLTQDQNRKAELGDEEVFVQGSIDLLLTTESGRILVDYKTDRIRDGEKFETYRARMLASHASQLATYAQAVEELFGAPPEKVYLYSLPWGRLIEVS